MIIYPVKLGVLNTEITRRMSGHAAGMEQVITAIDHLTGGMKWRRGDTGEDVDGVGDGIELWPGVDDNIFAPKCAGAIPTVSDWAWSS